MNDYPDKMTPEQARTFRDDVLNIVSQIPRGMVTTTPLSSCRKYRRAHSPWMESSAPFIRGRRCLL